MPAAPTLTVRLPDATRSLLDRAAKSTHRSRSYLVKEALERHLNDITQEQGGKAKSRIAALREIAGVGVRLVGPQTTEEIDARIREFRGDE